MHSNGPDLRSRFALLVKLDLMPRLSAGFITIYFTISAKYYRTQKAISETFSRPMTQKRFTNQISHVGNPFRTELAGEHLGILGIPAKPLSSVHGVRVPGIDELVLLFWRFGIWWRRKGRQRVWVAESNWEGEQGTCLGGIDRSQRTRSPITKSSSLPQHLLLRCN
jgi:hypothetical protein